MPMSPKCASEDCGEDAIDGEELCNACKWEDGKYDREYDRVRERELRSW